MTVADISRLASIADAMVAELAPARPLTHARLRARLALAHACAVEAAEALHHLERIARDELQATTGREALP